MLIQHQKNNFRNFFSIENEPFNISSTLKGS
jgi:hypothetical protein